jgi:hypothetical protein
MENSVKAWGSVNACAEYALLQLSTTSSGLAGWNYASTTGELKTDIDGSGNSCYIYKIEPFFATSTDCLNPLKRCIRASSTVPSVGPGFTRKLLIEVATNTPIVTVDSWSEVADF